MAENEERSPKQRDRGDKRRGSGKGRGKKGRGGRDEKTPPVPPALMRGPRPVKAKPAAEPAPENTDSDAADSETNLPPSEAAESSEDSQTAS